MVVEATHDVLEYVRDYCVGKTFTYDLTTYRSTTGLFGRFKHDYTVIDVIIGEDGLYNVQTNGSGTDAIHHIASILKYFGITSFRVDDECGHRFYKDGVVSWGYYRITAQLSYDAYDILNDASDYLRSIKDQLGYRTAIPEFTNPCLEIPMRRLGLLDLINAKKPILYDDS